VRIRVRGFVNGGFVLVGAALAGQLIDAEWVVNVVRIGSNGMPMGKWRMKQAMVVCRMVVMGRREMMVMA
jgi:hypothetical protein